MNHGDMTIIVRMQVGRNAVEIEKVISACATEEDVFVNFVFRDMVAQVKQAAIEKAEGRSCA
jgi:hypothetical protein